MTGRFADAATAIARGNTDVLGNIGQEASQVDYRACGKVKPDSINAGMDICGVDRCS